MTPSEVARLLKVSEQTVLREIDRGELRAFPVAKRWRVARDALEDYLSRPAEGPVIDPGAVSTLQVAEILHCTRENAWRLMSTQIIPSRRVGRAWVTRLSDVETYQRQHGASTEAPSAAESPN
ncbi:hypothetical protein CGZ98_06050 [Enemella evansiae]|nr:hypothetical protein CGZ98_06050 [Enemella evansiae]